jgi:CRP-like cAMP-binding protein
MATEPKMVKTLDCFQGLSEKQIQAIAGISNSVCYFPGHVLFNQGDHGKYLYHLIDGEIEVSYQTGESGMSKVDSVSCQEVVGCAALVPPYIYTATETCLTEVEVLEIEVDAMRDLFKKDPQLGLILQEYIIKKLNDRILKLRSKELG